MIRTAVLASILALSACTSGGTGPKPAQVPDRSILAEPIPDHGTFVPFAVDETVDALAFGMAPAIDSTDALRAAMGDGGREVIVPAGDYSIGRLVVPKRTILRLKAGVILRDTGKLSPVEQLLSLSDDTLVIGYGAKLVADRSSYVGGEFRHGLLVKGSDNVRVEGLESSGHSGDGFYVGVGASNVELIGVIADNNRRNGLSVTSCINLYVRDSMFNNTRGTAPEFGIDIEPDNVTDALIGIVMVNVVTKANHKGGLEIYLDSYQDGAQADILIVGHTGGSYFTSKIRTTDRIRYVK